MYRRVTYAENPLYNGINTKGYMTYIITLTKANSKYQLNMLNRIIGKHAISSKYMSSISDAN